MAARLNRAHQEATREKIRAGLLVNALENHVLKEKKLDASQVSAALGLLKKCVPDLTRAEITGEGGVPVRLIAEVVLVRPNDKT